MGICRYLPYSRSSAVSLPCFSVVSYERGFSVYNFQSWWIATVKYWSDCSWAIISFRTVYDHDLLSNLFLILEYKGKPSCWAELRTPVRELQRHFWATGSELSQPEVRPSLLFYASNAKKFVLLSFFSLIKTIYSRVWSKPLPCDVKCPLPVDARRSKNAADKADTEAFPVAWNSTI